MVVLPQSKPRPRRNPFASLRAILALILREMSTTYGKSPGGYIWAVLEPAAGIALLTLIFSIGFRHPPLGTSFAYFYASGVLPYLMFHEISNKLGQTILFSRQLLEYPRVTFIDAFAARLLLNVTTILMTHFLVLGFILFYLDTNSEFDFSKIVLAYVMTICLGAGVGTLNGFLIPMYPLWQTVWAIATRPLFLISCIFFLFESVPRPYSDILWYNPLVHVVGQMRDGYFPYYHPNYVSSVYVFTVAAVTGIAGLFLLHHYHRDILQK